ncbi:MAG: beta-propeller fold lactonase family protein [Verrucomicrobiota bacterium]
MIWLVLGALFLAGGTLRADSSLYVSLAGDKRIAHYGIDPASGMLRVKGSTPLKGEPGALVMSPDGRILFAAVRSEGKLASFSVDPAKGSLTPLSLVAAAADPAFVATDRTGRFLLTAYYVAGQVSVHAIQPNGALQAEAAQWVTTDDKAHGILVDATNQRILVPHTGPNAIHRFGWDAAAGKLLAGMAPIEQAEETGPRHLVFHPGRQDRVYAINEQGGSVSVYAFDGKTGTMDELETVSTLPTAFKEKNACADIEFTPDGRFLIASNRGHDSLTSFAVDEAGLLTLVGQFPTEPTPRQFAIEPGGRFLYAAGQSSGKLAVFEILASGGLKRIGTVAVGEKPWWVLAAGGGE